MMVSGQQLKFKEASAKVRAEGVKPFTKAFGKRMKQLLGRGKKAVKSVAPKRRKSKTKQTKTVKSKSTRKSTVAAKKSGGKKKGTSMRTRLVKFGAGAGIGALIAILATALKRQEINATAPIIDAAAGVGVEGQVGTAIMRVGVPLITRALSGNRFGGNGQNAMVEGGA